MVLLGVVAVEGEEEVEEEAAALETVSLCARRGSDTDDPLDKGGPPTNGKASRQGIRADEDRMVVAR